jgi:opacity protein-like surface antigen
VAAAFLSGTISLADTSVGVSGIMNSASWSTSDGEYSSLSRFGAGVWRRSENDAILGDFRLQYVGRGAQESASSSMFDQYDRHWHHALSYVEFQTAVGAKLGRGKVQPYVMTGMSVGALLSAKRTFKENVQDEFTPTGSDDIKDDFRSVDFTWSLGAGVSFKVGARPVSVEAQYGLGLTNIARALGHSVKNRGLQVSVGVPLWVRRSLNYGVGNKRFASPEEAIDYQRTAGVAVVVEIRPTDTPVHGRLLVVLPTRETIQRRHVRGRAATSADLEFVTTTVANDQRSIVQAISKRGIFDDVRQAEDAAPERAVIADCDYLLFPEPDGWFLRTARNPSPRRIAAAETGRGAVLEFLVALELAVRDR